MICGSKDHEAIQDIKNFVIEKMNESLYEAIDLFDKIYTDFNDDFSLYMIAYIFIVVSIINHMFQFAIMELIND